MWKVKVYSFTLIFGHPITTSSSGPLNCFHSSEVTFIYDCPLKWTLPRIPKTFQIGPHFGLHLHLFLGHQREKGDIATKDQGKAHFLSGMQNA